MANTIDSSLAGLRTGYVNAQAADSVEGAKVTRAELQTVITSLRRDGTSPAMLEAALIKLEASDPAIAARYREAAGIAGPSEITRRIRSTAAAYGGPYTVPGASGPVSAPAAFRMNGGMNQPTPEKALATTSKAIRDGGQWPKDAAASKRLNTALIRCAYGRGSPADVKLVTQSLINAGALTPFLSTPPDHALAIRRMQWDYGMGVDCNGTVRAQYAAMHGGRQPVGSWGDALNLSAPNFQKVPTTQARPGDIIKLDDLHGDVGHNVIVEEVRSIPSPSAAGITGSPAPRGPLTAITVTSSWGAGGDPDNSHGGVRAETWVQDQATGKWGTLEGNTIQWSSSSGPYEHAMNGIFHPTEPVTSNAP